MNYTKLLITGGFVCLAVLMAQAVFVAEANAGIQCSGGSCWVSVCDTNSDCGNNHFVSGAYSCQGSNFYQNYITYQCNNPGSQNASCASSKSPKLVQTCSQTQKCEIGLWFNGCATSNVGTGTGTGTGTNPNCNLNSYKQCINGISYWYDSCSNIQSVAQNCNTAGQICQNGQCVNNTPPASYNPYAGKTCYQKNVYWRDSFGYATELFKICNDLDNSTADNCQSGQCVYTPAATGTTGTGTGTSGQNQAAPIAVTMLASKESTPAQLNKNLAVANGEKVNFVITIKNTSAQLLENVSVNADFAGSINYGNDLKIDDTAANGNIVAGVTVGSIAPNASKFITFSGTVQNLGAKTFQVTARASAPNSSNTDFLTMTVSSAGTAAVSESGNGNTIWEFIKSWFIWIIILIVLAALFVIIFRRLSDDNA